VYKVGWPAWKTVARLGVPVLVRVSVHHDAETGTFWADSPDLDGMIVSGADLDELHQEVVHAANELLTEAIQSSRARATTEMRIRDSAILAA
jgi:predicted RNase H-like HicB family nuclease